MDCLLKCYLEHLSDLPRNTLHDRRKRRAMVEYISTLIEGCSLGEECDRQKVVREAVISLLRYHEESRHGNGSICMMGKFHNILYVAMKICYDWQLQDTGTVIALLEQIYSCESTFERIFVGAIFGTKAPHYIAGWKSDFDDQEENLRAVVYFIDHATTGCLELPFGKEETMTRFVDVPIESCGKASALKICVQLGLPDKLHILLRYGAAIGDTSENIDLIEHTLRRLMEFRHAYPYNLVACLQLLLRVVPRITLDTEEKFETPNEKLLEEYKDLLDDAIIPLSRSGMQAPELKHLARCTVRQRLWQNYQLPNGIRKLPIPDTLRRYVDIMCD